MSLFTIVLVVKQFTHDKDDNFERFATIGMPTYEKYLDIKDLKDFIIITPANEQDTLKPMLEDKWPSWPWKFISEDKLIDKSIHSGWPRQQTSKLAISMLVTTDHYLIIDDDTYLTRPFGYADMFDSEGKVVFNRTLIDFPFFFLWSNQVLEFDFNLVQKEDWHMSITPEIFITNEVRGLVKWLVNRYGDNKAWQRFLAEHKYTEYCLYWIWLIMNDKKHLRLYSTLGDKELFAHATTSPDHDMQLFVDRSFERGAHYFSFVQSSAGHNISAVREAVMKHIQV
jgi:hypothetical protein